MCVFAGWTFRCFVGEGREIEDSQRYVEPAPSSALSKGVVVSGRNLPCCGVYQASAAVQRRANRTDCLVAFECVSTFFKSRACSGRSVWLTSPLAEFVSSPLALNRYHKLATMMFTYVHTYILWYSMCTFCFSLVRFSLPADSTIGDSVGGFFFSSSFANRPKTAQHIARSGRPTAFRSMYCRRKRVFGVVCGESSTHARRLSIFCVLSLFPDAVFLVKAGSSGIFGLPSSSDPTR